MLKSRLGRSTKAKSAHAPDSAAQDLSIISRSQHARSSGDLSSDVTDLVPDCVNLSATIGMGLHARIQQPLQTSGDFW